MARASTSKTRWTWPVLSVALAAGPARPAAPAIVSNTYENLSAARGLKDVPVTLSRIGADGHFTQGIAPAIGGRKLPAQVDVLRRAPDGSIRHALVSFVLPELPAGGKVRIDWLNERPPDPPAFRPAADLKRLQLRLVLTPEKGHVLTSVVGRALSGDPAGRGVKTLRDGPVMKEVEIREVPVDPGGRPDPHLEVLWRLRTFTGQKSVRVSAVVERCKPRKKSGPEPIHYKFRGVRLLCGKETLYEAGPYDHLDQTRYRILAWTDGPIEEIHRRPDYEYWWKGRFVPRYRWAGKAEAPKAVDAFYARRDPMRAHPQRPQGILESGIILRHMPNTGGRWDLGPYPSWAAAYLLAGGGPETYRAILHADGNGGGAFFVHVRQHGAPGYNVFTVSQPPLDQGYRIPLYRLPDGSRPPAQPDHAHAPSIGYLGYLLTGDEYYAEELSFWASYHAGEWPHKGLNWQPMDRSFAYSLRQVTDAAFILPDGHPLAAYYAKVLSKCFREMNQRLVKSNRRVHSPLVGNFQCSGRQNWVNALRCSPWMYAWVVWALGNAADKGFAEAAPVRDWAAEYIVGLYTSDDEFRAPDGKVYRCEPRDAMPYSTAIALIDTQVVTLPDGKKGVKATGGEPRPIENYGAVWYYTKLNVDNGWYPQRGLEALPDDKGVWPLRPVGKGFGAGKMYWAWERKVRPHFNYHLQAMTGLAVACDAKVPRAEQAWKLMMQHGARRGEYGIHLVPRSPGSW